MSDTRIRFELSGVVQGVGLRPFVAGLAARLQMTGSVCNTGGGVVIEVQGSPSNLAEFEQALRSPPHGAVLSALERKLLDLRIETDFRILASENMGVGAWPPVDVATCSECLSEMADPKNRRFAHPFISCTQCGPRYSTLRHMPFDRANTTLADFEMCTDCSAEYRDPSNRRFHAQTLSCHACGPRVWYAERDGIPRAWNGDALQQSIRALVAGRIVAVKGIGGFHLLVDARNAEAVALLRQRKQRDAKPFAVLFSSLQEIRVNCEVSGQEEKVLSAALAPIVLLRKLQTCELAENVTPGNPLLGAFLPYSPLHHLLLVQFKGPLVATSANLSGDVLCIDNEDALQRLNGITDAFLFHDRPIVRALDDSVMRVLAGEPTVLRRARGLAPLPVQVATELSPRLALGGHLKSTVAVAVGKDIFLSQHLGDLDAVPARDGFVAASADLCKISPAAALHVVCDLHPDYVSSHFAQKLEKSGSRIERVQHHVAHVFSVIAEHALRPPLLGVAWDGTGLGLDGSIWGGEFFRVCEDVIQRVAHLYPFPLPGGNAAVVEPRRAALGVLHALEQFEYAMRFLPTFSDSELKTYATMLSRGINTPRCSSAGRLCDAVAALLRVRDVNDFEAQAAMELEFLAECDECDLSRYQFELAEEILDWRPVIRKMLDDVKMRIPMARIAREFHQALIRGIVMVAERGHIQTVALSGGCFQNRLLLEGTVARLREKGFHVYWNQRVPINDGGLAVGQILATQHPAGSVTGK